MIGGGRMSARNISAAAFRMREIGLVIGLAVTIVFFAARASNFLTVGNWQGIAQNVAIVLVVAVGETMVILTRNIDLSVGSIVGLSAYLSAATFVHHSNLPLPVVALIAIAVGLGLGIVNGLLVAVARIPASFLNLASSRPLGVPALAWIAIGITVLGALVLRWAPWARDFYAIGSNPDAARFAGIPAVRRVITAFAVCGALAGLGGFMFAARFPTVDAVAAKNFELDVITAAVIGGVNVFGGAGTILGVVLGALLVETIQSGFTLLRISEFWRLFFNGFAIVVAVTIDALVTRRLQTALRRRRAEVLAARHLEAGS